MVEAWHDYEKIRVGGIGGYIRLDQQYQEKDVSGTWTKPQPRIELVLYGREYGYGSMAPAGTEKRNIVSEKTVIDVLRKKIGRPHIKEVVREKTERRIPQREDSNPYADIYFRLQQLVQQCQLTEPHFGDDYISTTSLFWYSTRSMEVQEFINMLRAGDVDIQKEHI